VLHLSQDTELYGFKKYHNTLVAMPTALGSGNHIGVVGAPQRKQRRRRRGEKWETLKRNSKKIRVQQFTDVRTSVNC